MIGAIAGDIVGSVYEANPIKSKDFPLFHPRAHVTDDSVLSLAVAEAILSERSYQSALRDFARRYPNAGYGGMFRDWARSDVPQPYGSWGNGSAMRVSAVGWAYNSLGEVLHQAAASARVTHNHPEGIKGAEAIASAVFLARIGDSKDEIRKNISSRFGYDLERTIADIRPNYSFDVSCAGSVPEAIIAFLESTDWEDAVRNAVSLGGDSDTLASMAGAIAEAYYGPPPVHVQEQTRSRLPDELYEILYRFETRFSVTRPNR